PYQVETQSFETMKGPAYRKIHPLGAVPAIQDGDVTMFESGAILEYLLERYGKGRLAPAAGTPGRAPYLQWLHFGEATMAPRGGAAGGRRPPAHDVPARAAARGGGGRRGPRAVHPAARRARRGARRARAPLRRVHGGRRHGGLRAPSRRHVRHGARRASERAGV